METPENKPENQEGVRMSHVLLIVLALHVLIIGGAFAYHWLRGDSQLDMMAENAQGKQPEVAAEPAPANETPEADPVVDTSPEPGVQQAMEAQEAEVLRAAMTAKAKPTDVAQAPVQQSPAGVAAKTVSPPASVASKLADGQTYKVHKGDTLHRIAKEYRLSVTDLRQANGLNGDMIRLGQVLKIPAAAQGAKAVPATPVVAEVKKAPKTAPAATPASSSARAYVVSKGDTVTRIAKKFNVPVKSLMEANNIQDPTKLRIGEKLVVPVEAAATEVNPAPSSGGEPSRVAMVKP
jgi:LysM repeat protein